MRKLTLILALMGLFLGFGNINQAWAQSQSMSVDFLAEALEETGGTGSPTLSTPDSVWDTQPGCNTTAISATHCGACDLTGGFRGRNVTLRVTCEDTLSGGSYSFNDTVCSECTPVPPPPNKRSARPNQLSNQGKWKLNHFFSVSEYWVYSTGHEGYNIPSSGGRVVFLSEQNGNRLFIAEEMFLQDYPDAVIMLEGQIHSSQPLPRQEEEEIIGRQ